MKKILLITMMVLTVQVGAVDDTFDFNSGGSGAAADTYNSAGADNYNFGGADTYNYGGSDNIMLGGGDSNSAAGSGLGNSRNTYGSEFNRASPFSTDNSSVPKLSLMGLVMWVGGILNQLVYVIMGAALVSFLYGILKLSFVDGQKPESREQARKFMFWGIVSLFVMVSVWGLVRILHVTLFGPGDLIIPRLK